MSETTQDQPDLFQEAFARLSALGDDASAMETDSIMGAQGDAPPAEPAEGQDTLPAGETPAAEGQEPAAEEQPAEEGQEPATEPAPAPKAGQEDDDLLRRLSDLVRKGAPAEPAAAPAREEPEAAAPVYTKEEQEFLQSYEKDWPDVARAEMLRRRAEYQQLATFIFSEVGAYLKPHLDALQSVAVRTHVSDLEAKVPDYDDVRDKVVDWVGTQPKYLQAAYEQVIREGTVDEVEDLIARWRQSTGASTTQPQPARAKATVLPPATKQAAAAMAPVGSKRSAPAAGVDPSDFDGAFAVAAAGRD